MENKENTISVVVPVYNVARLLPRCIDSILSQTVKPFEILLVDDGSPDNCGAICDDYAGRFEHIRVIHKENGGLSSARKSGFCHARGELIVFIDSDDYIHPQYLEHLSAPMADENVQLSICGYFLDNNGDIKPCRLPFERDRIETSDLARDYILPMVGRSKKAGEKDLPGFVPVRMYRKGLLRESDFISEREYFTEDVLLNILYGKRITGRIAVVNEPLYYYCINPGSLTLKYRENAYEMRMACNRLIASLIADLPASADEKKRRLDGNMISAITFCIYNSGRLPDYVSFRRTLKDLLRRPETAALFASGKWPTAATWHKIILACYRLKAWLPLYILLKTRKH